MSIDDFRRIDRSDPPNHLKVDVDGVEEEILHGATPTLGDKRVGSIPIEPTPDDAAPKGRFIGFFESHGFAKRVDYGEERNMVFSR